MEDRIDILLVEDSPSDVRLTQEALKRSDLHYNMAVAQDGVEAMDYLNQLLRSTSKLPDLILLDLNMPKKNGHEVLADIKEDAQLRKIPVVLLTVSQNDEDVAEALRLKMNYYMAKPVTHQKLSVLVKSIYELQSEAGQGEHQQSDEEAHIRLVLASNPHSSAMVLTRLADDKLERVRCRVAENPQAPVDLLEKLADDPSAEVRQSVSENRNAPQSLLEKLARDPSEDVRLAVAANPQIPAQILASLSEDENIYVASQANKTLSSQRAGS